MYTVADTTLRPGARLKRRLSGPWGKAPVMYQDQAFARGVKFAALDARAVTDALRTGGQGLYRNIHATVLPDGEATLQKIEQTFAPGAARRHARRRRTL